jgi:hypothetical protein
VGEDVFDIHLEAIRTLVLKDPEVLKVVVANSAQKVLPSRNRYIELSAVFCDVNNESATLPLSSYSSLIIELLIRENLIPVPSR